MDEQDGFPTPYSSDSEGSVLREFMDSQEEQGRTRQSRQSQAASRPPSTSVRQSLSGHRSDVEESSATAFPFPKQFGLSEGSHPQEPNGGAQEQQNQSNRYSNVTRVTFQEPGPSNQQSRLSQSRLEVPPVSVHHELAQVAQTEAPHQSLYSVDSEGDILRAFVDAQDEQGSEPRTPQPIARPTSTSTRKSTQPRTSRASQKSRAVSTSTSGMHSSLSSPYSHRRSRSHNEVASRGSLTVDEAMRQLTQQKKKTHDLRRELRLAVERVDSESQRVAAFEHSSLQAIEQLTALNETKLKAQQEALKAASELRLYQFELENAHKEIERAQDVVKELENQRDEAEESASRAREKARKYLQERMISEAKEEGRRLGFEAGLRRAQEEADYLDVGMSGRPTTQARVDEQFQVTAIRNDIDLDAISSPIHQRTPRARRQSLPRRPSPPPREPTVESPSPTESDYHVVEDAPQSYLHPPQPPNIARSASPGPSIVRYAVDIPSAAQIEQNQSIGKSTQPWVTAHEYHRITGTQPSPENNFHANFGDRPRGVSFVTPSGNPGKKKESWLRRTLSKPWRKSRTVQEAPISWYQTTQQPPETSQPSESSVHVRDFGGTEPSQGRPSLDAASVSTRVSQLEIVNPPSNPTAPSYKSASERSFGSGANKGKKKARDRYSMLRVINEDDDPAAGPSMATTARHSSAPTPVSPSMGQIKALLSDTASNYSNPKVLDDWRRSSASGAGTSAVLSMNAGAGPRSASASASAPASQRQTVPPRRRPVHLSVPAPLASPSHDPPSSSTMPATTASSSQPSASEFLGVNPQDFRPGLQRSVTSGTVYGITVEPPSRSPTEAPNSARPPQGHFLSPEHTYVPNLPILTPSPQNVGQPHGREYTAPPSIRQQPSRPGSVASSRPPPAPLPKSPQHLPSYSLPPSHRPPSQSQQHAGPDRTHRTSAASSTMPMSMPRNSAPQPLADNASIRSGAHSVHTNGISNTLRPISTNIKPGPSNLSPSPVNETQGHRRTFSDSTYLMPNEVNTPVNGNDHPLYRVASNQSMASIRSANSQYARFDPNTYVEPTQLYRPVSAAGSRSSMNGHEHGHGQRQRAQSNASGSTLSYISHT